MFSTPPSHQPLALLCLVSFFFFFFFLFLPFQQPVREAAAAAFVLQGRLEKSSAEVRRLQRELAERDGLISGFMER